ncbi:hypothetical protein ACOME3_005939 [Neoechinorhynchus agilis]
MYPVNHIKKNESTYSHPHCIRHTVTHINRTRTQHSYVSFCNRCFFNWFLCSIMHRRHSETDSSSGLEEKMLKLSIRLLKSDTPRTPEDEGEEECCLVEYERHEKEIVELNEEGEDSTVQGRRQQHSSPITYKQEGHIPSLKKLLWIVPVAQVDSTNDDNDAAAVYLIAQKCTYKYNASEAITLLSRNPRRYDKCEQDALEGRVRECNQL